MTNLDELVRFFRISADSLMYFDIEKEMESFKNEEDKDWRVCLYEFYNLISPSISRSRRTHLSELN